ncbi:DUF3859 domain-containing protein [Jannaschia sp. W003]|uniref:DUF3859 domain-containing protein n=1 Tax=Jannaschia sp. W003 TaxID=2867012 RepID=UPI0021A5EE3D|nr:DUF3859 domain-containing protein [Jannaschia sp. W003]UWQ21270.1 DUF3859 domain-containing protein [Jannaschia sp. W003]
MRPRLIPLLLLACALPFGAAQARVRLVEAGIVCPALREASGQRPAPDTQTGTVDILSAGVEFDLPDRVVPAMQHLGFGLRVEVEAGEPETELLIVVEHPPTGPEGVTRESWTQVAAGGERSLNLFTFDYPYEMVPGPWTFSIEVEGERVVEVPFTVGDRFANARVDAACLEMLNA